MNYANSYKTKETLSKIILEASFQLFEQIELKLIQIIT